MLSLTKGACIGNSSTNDGGHEWVQRRFVLHIKWFYTISKAVFFDKGEIEIFHLY